MEREVFVYNLYNGHSQSCGCLQKKRAGQTATTHGEARTSLWYVWCAIKQRCTNPKNKSWKNYGGRGITLDPEWQQYEPFAMWARANGYEDGLEIDRVDNDGPYSPKNCQWILRWENRRNSRSVRKITAWGETKLMIEWIADPRCKVKYQTIWDRIHVGWTPEDAISLPVGSRGHRPPK